MDDFYRTEILTHYKNPQNYGHLPSFDLKGSSENDLCGDSIEVEIKLKKDIISDISFTGIGCVISTATASLLTQKIKGEKLQKVKKMNSKDILAILGIQLTPVRLKCALLPLEAIQKTLALVK